MYGFSFYIYLFIVARDKYLQRAAEMTTKLENEYAAKLGPSPNIVPDLQFFRKPLEDVKNMHAVEPKDGKSDALSLDDSGEMVGQLTFDGEKKENPQDQSERLLVPISLLRPIFSTNFLFRALVSLRRMKLVNTLIFLLMVPRLMHHSQS